MVVCQQKEWADGNWSLAAEPPSGQLNPINDMVYEVSHNLITGAVTLMRENSILLIKRHGTESLTHLILIYSVTSIFPNKLLQMPWQK